MTIAERSTSALPGFPPEHVTPPGERLPVRPWRDLPGHRLATGEDYQNGVRIAYTITIPQTEDTPAKTFDYVETNRFRYTNGVLLGKGGFSEVYRARDEQMGLDVVIKAVRISVRDDAENLKREGWLLARMEGNRSILDAYDFFEHDGYAYLVMRHKPGGQTLGAVIRNAKGKPLAPHVINRVMEAGARALDGLAWMGTRSGDNKPGNILYHPDPDEEIVYFDLNGSPDALQHPPTSTIGTFHYSAPEQYAKKPVDHRSDIYTQGIILFRMLTNHYPFRPKLFNKYQKASVNRLYRAMMQEDRRSLWDFPKVIATYGPAAVYALELILHKALRFDPDDRYQSATELADDVARALARVPEPVTSGAHEQTDARITKDAGVTTLSFSTTG